MSAPPKCFHCDRTWPTERERELAAEVERLRAAKDDALRRVASLCAEVERIARERDERPVPHGPECPCMRCRCGS